MSINASLVGKLNDIRVNVTPFGQLVVAPLEYSSPITMAMDTIGVAFNFMAPVSDHFIVVTDIIVSADKDVSNTTPADVDIFTADAHDSVTPINEILRPQLTRASNFSLTGLNLKIDPGVWINATTTDTIVLLTVMFYRVRNG